MTDIVLIAPFDDLAENAKKIILENHLNIDVLVGDLSEGVKVAQKCVKDGAQIIISRGGTYTMIKDAVDVPVVEIKISSFDILRGFRDVINYKGKIGVAGYKNIIHGSETVAELLNLDIEKIVLDNEDQVPELIKNLITKGINVIIGDSIGYKNAKKLGFSSYIITSGKESILDAIQEAQRILKVSKIEKTKTERIRIIMDFVHDGIMSIDNNGYITSFNATAEKIFGLDSKEIIGKKVDDVIPNTKMLEILKTGKKELNEIQDIKKSKIATNRIPIIVDNKIEGVVATFQDITQVQEMERKIRHELAKKGFIAKYKFNDIIYKSNIMDICINKAKKFSLSDSPVLIIGKTGVGKELFAQSIHNASNRSKGPFVAVNCAAIPPSLLESELFGYVEGAFTGANKNGKQGLFELAHRGTIFLDEIGEIPLEYQARLLRVLQEKQVMRIGDDKVIPIDVRVISATNKNLRQLVDEGKFREDLFYRINILTLYVPQLNERRDDIILLAEHFIKLYAEKYSKKFISLSKEAANYLLSYDYKGNVRELEGIIERAVSLCSSNKIEIDDICDDQNNYFNDDQNNYFNNNKTDNIPLLSLKDFEKGYIKDIVSKCDGNLTKAAKILGINRSTIWRKLKTD
ncbi:sigma 54-interacting transcriptional regulator [Thermoanaerobacterium thermosaccharolyticum]|uniref:sigma 54-interacting transcriptional regulator n=1 Tax=Thermoanaerobacterium thermosaccharolyticum TaxID=1517 RepID=UPI00177BD43B|nr:sigma 54-interacting transcriptional regulator [Thermoanaerobacterium thermosaccharolyticum]MBE0069328.1 PAS domain S-box protein [Thermoanaerobacterium thermosaccharolyticum]MBE0229108.1 PAS domain S-box protein [Thermoanaerobacterium thermosaccharolyticum]